MITTTQVVDTSATCNSLSKDYSHPDDHTRQVTDILGFKSFTNSLSKEYSHPDDHTRQATDTLGFKSFTNSFLKNTLTQTITQDKQHTLCYLSIPECGLDIYLFHCRFRLLNEIIICGPMEALGWLLVSFSEEKWRFWVSWQMSQYPSSPKR